MTQEQNTNKERSPDRILVLKPIDGKPLDTTGMTDPRLFKGENRLHAIMEEDSCLWKLKYESGTLPPFLKGKKYTSFKLLKQDAEGYFKGRNIEIKEVQD